jgi:hypothetical protein
MTRTISAPTMIKSKPPIMKNGNCSERSSFRDFGSATAGSGTWRRDTTDAGGTGVAG